MKIAVFGATGGTGRQVVSQALAQGHSVKALARDPVRLPITHEHLEIIVGNVLDPGSVEATLAGTDAAVISLGNTADNPDYVVSKGTEVIIAAMQKLGLRRVVAVSSIGVGDSADQVPFAFKILMRTVLKKPMEDKERQEAILKNSGLEWIIVRPGGLTDGPGTGRYKSGLDPKISAGQVSRADVADFVLKQLTDDMYLRKTPAIT